MSKMKPIIKWAGGKEKELDYIIPNLPRSFDVYYEPFVGGGSVFMAMTANHLYINDLSKELKDLYNNIGTDNPSFFSYAYGIDGAWGKAHVFLIDHEELVQLFLAYRRQQIDSVQLRAAINDFCDDHALDILGIISALPPLDTGILLSEMKKNLFRKFSRMKVLEQQKHELSQADVGDNIETAVKSAVYMYFRFLYNDKALCLSDPIYANSLFLFIRNYAYSGMFRYNDNGDFNVPYGGMAYNNKFLAAKLQYYRSRELQSHFSRTTIENLDFETFLRKYQPKVSDFIFLDPPYDSEFSTYAGNEFSKDDHRRLSKYLLNECVARWMLLIKNTDFIYSLYSGYDGINISSFDKEYVVSFMNRNDKKTTHLLITNYRND